MSTSARNPDDEPNRIIPVTLLILWVGATCLWMGAKGVLSWPAASCFVALLLGLALFGLVLFERCRKGYYTDGDVIGLFVAIGVTLLVLGFGWIYIDSLKAIGIIFMVTVALARFTIVGTKPSGLYKALVTYVENRDRRLQSKRQSDGLDAVLAASRDDKLEPQQA